MKLGYARISKADGSQTLDLQIDALMDADVCPNHIYKDEASGKKDNRPGLEACLKALRKGDTLYIWKLDQRAGMVLVNFIYNCTFYIRENLFIIRCEK